MTKYRNGLTMISANIKRNFKFDINSTENQGRFRINDPKIFKRMWTRHDPVHKGISYIVGTKQNGEFSTQSIRFNRAIWSEKKAASWWKGNKKRFIKYKTKPLKRKNPEVIAASSISMKRKNPTSNDLFSALSKEIDNLIDKTETILLNYNNAFKTLYELGKWEKCKNIILYYMSFLEAMIMEVDYIIDGEKTTPLQTSNKDYEQVLKHGFIYVSKRKKEEYMLPPIAWLFFKLEGLKSENEYVPQQLNLRIAYQKSLLKRFTEFYELLEINYKEFFKDIQICLKK